MGSGKGLGYVIGGLEIVIGAVLTAVGLGTFGVPLMIAGAGTIAGTALSPTPPRPRNLRDSPNYGVDQLDNPRGPDALVPIVLGTSRVRCPVIAESVYSVAEADSPGIDAQRKQGVRALYAVAEGPVAVIRDVKINDRDVLSGVKESKLGTGNNSKKAFDFPERWVWFGTDELPDVDVLVNGVLKSWSKKSVSQDFMTAAYVSYVPSVGPVEFPKVEWWTITIARANKQERILEDAIRVFVRGPGYPETEQFRRQGVYRFSAQKVRAWKVKLRFKLWVPAGYTVRVAYDYLGADGMWVQRDFKGRCEVVFGTAVPTGHAVIARYRVAAFPRLRMQLRFGTLDQAPMEGFSDLVQSYNPDGDRSLPKNSPVTYSTKGRQADELRIGIIAPAGCVAFKDDGGTNPVSVKVKIEYRKQGTTTWTTLKSQSGDSFKLTAEKSGRVVWEIPIADSWRVLFEAGDAAAGDAWDAFERAAYEVRVTRLDTVNTDLLVQDDIEFGYVTEVLREGFVYPGTALLGLDVQPSEGLSGTSPRVTVVVEKGNTLYDPRTDRHYGRRDLKSSQNAALAIRYLVTSDEGAATERFGGGHFFTGADFFLGADGRWSGAPPNEQPLTDGGGFIAFADFCDEWVHRPGDDPALPAYSATYASVPPYTSSNGERRCRLNRVLDTPQSLMETVTDLAFLGYCFATLQGATWRFPLDQDGPSVFTFYDDVDPERQNAWDVRLEMDKLSALPSHVVAQFWNEELDFERDEFPYPVDPFPDSLPVNERQVNLAGCSRVTEAMRMARHLAQQAVAAPFVLSWKAHPGVQDVEAADIVTLKTRIPYSTGPTALELKVRVLTISVDTDEEGRIDVRLTGRVISGSPYALPMAAIPKTGPNPYTGTGLGTGTGSGAVIGTSEGAFTGAGGGASGNAGGGTSLGGGAGIGAALAVNSQITARLAVRGLNARLA